MKLTWEVLASGCAVGFRTQIFAFTLTLYIAHLAGGKSGFQQYLFVEIQNQYRKVVLGIYGDVVTTLCLVLNTCFLMKGL